MESMEEFGLTGYESRAYLSLLSIGASDARKVSSRSSVPFGRIYDVLSSLVSKGIVEVQASRPKRYMAIEPKNSIKRLIEMKNQEVSALIRKAGKTEELLNGISLKTKNESLFWSVAVGDDIMKAHLDRLNETEKELLTYVDISAEDMNSKAKKEWSIKFLQSVGELAGKGVKIKLLIGIKKREDLKKLEEFASAFKDVFRRIETRSIGLISNPFDVMDSKKVHLKVRNPARPQEYFSVVYVWEERFAKELKIKFNEMWQDADVLKIDRLIF